MEKTRIRKTKAILQEENETLRAKYGRSLAERRKQDEELQEARTQWTKLEKRDHAYRELLNSQYRLIVEYDSTSEQERWIYYDFDTRQSLVKHWSLVEGYKCAIAVRKREWARRG